MKKEKDDIFTKEEIKTNTKKLGKSEAELKRDITPMFDYYKAWDKFTKDVSNEDIFYSYFHAMFQKVEEGSDDEEKDQVKETPDFIPAKNPVPEKDKGPLT